MHKLIACTTLFWAILTFQSVGQAASDLEDINGHKISMSSLEGKWVFINYWASWCGPCVEEISELNHFYAAKYANKVAVFAVNYDAVSLSKQRRLVKDYAIQYPSLNPRSLRFLHLEPISVLPVTYVFDPEGHLSTTLYGGQTESGLKKLIY